MHNKYAVIDEKTVVTGSFNWTNKAVNLNHENIVIINSEEVSNDFKKNFFSMWTDFIDHKIVPNPQD